MKTKNVQPGQKKGSSKQYRWFGITIVLVGIFFVFNPFNKKRVSEEHYYKCPLTGYDRTVYIENGKVQSEQLGGNEVSKWAEQNGIPGVTPGQLGWELASTETTEGFDPPRFGCAMPHLIPYRIFTKSLTVEGMTQEEVLQKFQKSVLNSQRERTSLFQILEDSLAEFN